MRNPRRPTRVLLVAGAAMLLLSACQAEQEWTPPPPPSLSPVDTERTLSTRQLDAIMRRDGELAVTLNQFRSAWNAQADDNPGVALEITEFTTAEDGRVSYEFFEYLHMEGVVNPDGTLRSIALIDQTSFLDPAEVLRSSRGDRFAFMPMRAAFARFYLGGAIDPTLTREQQGRLFVTLIGTEDPEVILNFGTTPVEASHVENGIEYQLATDRSGRVWFIAHSAEDHRADAATGG